MIPTLTILVGIPGCGKSTWAEEVLRQPIVSSDAIRAILSDINDQSKNDQVFALFHKDLDHYLKGGHDVVADSTALDKRARLSLIEIARNAEADTHLIYFSNCRQAVLRNRIRDRKVPDDVMYRMLEKYERFTLALPHESYTRITEIASTA